jgi:hypothetical protein
VRAVSVISAALLAWTQVGYAALLWVLRRRGARPVQTDAGPAPVVSVIIAAHDEEAVIAHKVEDALAQEWPRDRLEVIVACDGCTDATAQLAREAGADRVLELPRGGKVRAQDAAVRAARGDILAFSDANSRWAIDALAELVAVFADPEVGYACGQVRFVSPAGDNQEGLYWRYELWQRAQESALASVTAGNGAIYAVRREAYFEGDPRVSHDLAFPFALVKQGWRCVYVPGAQAVEKMVPSIDGEWRRKRRMMAHAWPAIATGGLADPRGYPPLYALMIVSHRLLRYATPALHVASALSSRPSLAAHAALGAAAVAGGSQRAPRAAKVARYYVLTTASIAAGAADWLLHGTTPEWDVAEGAR